MSLPNCFKLQPAKTVTQNALSFSVCQHQVHYDYFPVAAAATCANIYYL